MLFAPLRDHAAVLSGADLVLTTGEIPGATAPDERLLIAPYHIHHEDDEGFYILAGRIAFEVDDQTFTAGTGDAVLVPRGAIHTWWNPDPSPAHYLIAMPKRVNDLIVALHSGPRSQEEMEALFREHAATYIGWTR
ncbi:MAG: cupin domain-containing protein [Thermomicrobiales bacterium]|nr:cupin domain-containing protein [Thermomicrobiales bacterium]